MIFLMLYICHFIKLILIRIQLKLKIYISSVAFKTVYVKVEVLLCII